MRLTERTQKAFILTVAFSGLITTVVDDRGGHAMAFELKSTAQGHTRGEARLMGQYRR